MKFRQQIAHMQVAHIYATLSYCNRMKVGCVIISPKGDRVMSIGYNGTPPGEDNNCECEKGLTKSNVIHAEDNALRKLEETTESAKDGYMFCTHSPCQPCAEKIKEAKIKQFFYMTPYKDTAPLTYLEQNGIQVTQLNITRDIINDK